MAHSYITFYIKGGGTSESEKRYTNSKIDGKEVRLKSYKCIQTKCIQRFVRQTLKNTLLEVSCKIQAFILFIILNKLRYIPAKIYFLYKNVLKF